MKFAINVPNFGEYGDPSLLMALARDAEDAGWDGFFILDHIQGFATGERVPMADPRVALAAITVATSRIRIGTMVTPIARRRPWKLARECVTLDHLSGGRVILGVGLGDPVASAFGAIGERDSAPLPQSEQEWFEQPLGRVDPSGTCWIFGRRPRRR